MKLSASGIALAATLALVGLARADIVWDGHRVDQWPIPPRPQGRVLDAEQTSESSAAAASHYASPKGKFYGLTLLVDFSDQPAPVTTQDVLDFLNKPGFDRDGCKGSVRDFYLDMSNGQLDFTNDAFGWYRAKHPKSWYEGLPGYSGSDSLLKETFAYFDAIVDFSRYDNDKDGTTEAVSIMYAGPGQTWGQGLWPHAGWAGQTRDGTKVNKYQMTDMGGKFALYVFVHECGHMVFGWPDLYWYGDYCTMANRANDLNPVAINDFFRADQGWIPFVDVTALDTGLVSTLGGEKTYRYRNPARPNDEGLVWSYLQNTGRRSVIRGSGLLVQHYDFSLGGNSSAEKLGLRLVHADSTGKGDFEVAQWPSGNDPRALFQSGTYPTFTDPLYPSTRWYDGTTTGMVFSEVGKPSSSLSFRLGPASGAAAATQWLEAEKAQVVSASLRSSTEASGGAYVGGLDGATSKVVFTANRERSGLCTLMVRYANGGTRNASHGLSINGSKDSLVYRPTSGWGRFDSAFVVASLIQGRNQIVLTKKTDFAEIDALRISTNTATSGLASGPGVRRGIDRKGNNLVGPADWIGAELAWFDLQGRALGRAVWKNSGDHAESVMNAGNRQAVVWRTLRDGRILSQGILPPR